MKNAKPRLVFFGTPKLAAEMLATLSHVFPISLVITQPDKPVGRTQSLEAPPVKTTALALGLSVIQPDSVKALEQELTGKQFDLGILFAYGMILPKKVRDHFTFGIANLHPSLLPQYRGASPVQSALIHGDTKTGVSLILLEDKMDAGPIVAQKAYPLDDSIMAEELTQRLVSAGTELLITTLPKILKGEITILPQDETRASICKILKREDGKINWAQSAKSIYNLYRGLTPWPGLYTQANNKRIKILEIEISDIVAQKPGLVRFQKNQLLIDANDKAIFIKTLQPEGKKPLSGLEFSQGYAKIINSVVE